MLVANAGYLQKLLDALSGKNVSITEYKLARKEVYINSANLSAAFQRMLSEPKSKQKNKNEIHQFVVLNHTLFSNIATIASSILSKKPCNHSEIIIRTAKKAQCNLFDSIEKFGEPMLASTSNTEKDQIDEPTESDLLLKEQLEFIHKLTSDIQKTSEKISA